MKKDNKEHFMYKTPEKHLIKYIIDSGRDLILFLNLYYIQTHQVIQENQVLQNTKSFLQIMA